MTSRVWKLQDAKNRFSEVVRRALSEGPQMVTSLGEEVVVVVAKEQFAALQRSDPGLVQFLRNSPLVGVDLDLERDRSLPGERQR